jgi:hypothetical protein
VEKTFKIVGNDLSDGYHTFDELYEHRVLLYLLCTETGALKASYVVEDHYEGWDLIVAFTPGNYQQVSYHVPNKYRWAYEKLERRSVDQQKEYYDGHTPQLVAHRLEMALRSLDCVQQPPTQGEK